MLIKGDKFRVIRSLYAGSYEYVGNIGIVLNAHIHYPMCVIVLPNNKTEKLRFANEELQKISMDE